MTTRGANALEVFGNLTGQAERLLAAASVSGIDSAQADSCRRAAILFSVAGVDSYFGEVAFEHVVEEITNASISEPRLNEISNYLGVNRDLLSGDEGPLYVRFRMSYKTLVAPDKIDRMLTALLGLNRPGDVWRHIAVLEGVGDQLVRAQLQVQYDRRNKIAHEGDWDHVKFELRAVADHDVLVALKWSKAVVHGAHAWIYKSRV